MARVSETYIFDKDEFFQELIEISDFRLRVLYIHLIIEYFLDSLIEIYFEEPDYIFKNFELYSFSNKLDLLKADGIISSPTYEQIKLVNAIRNYYAHNLVKMGAIPGPIVNRINALAKSASGGEFSRGGKIKITEDFKKAGVEIKFIYLCAYIIGRLYLPSEFLAKNQKLPREKVLADFRGRI
jgi:hypothetical protein